MGFTSGTTESPPQPRTDVGPPVADAAAFASQPGADESLRQAMTALVTALDPLGEAFAQEIAPRLGLGPVETLLGSLFMPGIPAGKAPKARRASEDIAQGLNDLWVRLGSKSKEDQAAAASLGNMLEVMLEQEMRDLPIGSRARDEKLLELLTQKAHTGQTRHSVFNELFGASAIADDVTSGAVSDDVLLAFLQDRANMLDDINLLDPVSPDHRAVLDMIEGVQTLTGEEQNITQILSSLSNAQDRRNQQTFQLIEKLLMDLNP